MRAAAAAALALVASCGREPIEVAHGRTADYNHGALVAAVEAFVSAGRTPAAFATLAHRIGELRSGMDKSVAQQAERKLVVLALEPVQALATKPMAEQERALALTVWPSLLAPPIEAEELLAVADPNTPLLVPRAGEEPGPYLQRLCGGPLAADCKHVVPEWQAQIVDALAIRRATERARNAVEDCMTCSGPDADPGWHAAVTGWEALDRAANADFSEIEQRAAPANWPIAGAASEDDPGLPEAELAPSGALLVDGHSYGPNAERIAVLRELRGSSDLLALHLHPDTTLAQVRGLLADARKAGCARIAVIAREPTYPWRRRAYWLADGYGLRIDLRPSDSLQLLLHALDETAGPGTVARVE